MKDEINRSDIVVSKAGRDKGKLMFVLTVYPDGTLALVDGKLRMLEKPKVKKAKHITLFQQGGDNRVAEKIRMEEKLTNSEIRKELANKVQEDASKGR